MGVGTTKAVAEAEGGGPCCDFCGTVNLDAEPGLFRTGYRYRVPSCSDSASCSTIKAARECNKCVGRSLAGGDTDPLCSQCEEGTEASLFCFDCPIAHPLCSQHASDHEQQHHSRLTTHHRPVQVRKLFRQSDGGSRKYFHFPYRRPVHRPDEITSGGESGPPTDEMPRCDFCGPIDLQANQGSYVVRYHSKPLGRGEWDTPVGETSECNQCVGRSRQADSAQRPQCSNAGTPNCSISDCAELRVCYECQSLYVTVFCKECADHHEEIYLHSTMMICRPGHAPHFPASWPMFGRRSYMHELRSSPFDDVACSNEFMYDGVPTEDRNPKDRATVDRTTEDRIPNDRVPT